MAVAGFDLRARALGPPQRGRVLAFLPSLDVWSVSARHSAQYRQGDLLFVRRSALPRGGTPRGGGVIERGEITGHAHRLVGGAAYDVGVRVSVEAGPEARVVHEEHGPLELPEGPYLVIRQREYRGEEESSHVRD